MGFFDILIGAAILNDLSKKRKNKSSDSIFGSSSYNRGYSDGYDDAWHDREFDNECDCGYCSDHDEDEEGVAEELMFQSATPEFISSSEINLN